ncbi:hypothetical protein HHK36_021247 [Tetracentron sinense]|uniref:Uncharacterized protein n=1 Tax=Tetracentron sinense TaxID=13715 RepID=A0A834YWK9_TETSI|nr:hypothetical protein HHK36_021247 [Tetracentron sinense]
MIDDRTVLLARNYPAVQRFDHEEFSTPPFLFGRTDEKEQRKMETTVAMLKLSKGQVEKLKKKANEGHIGQPYSRYEALAGHIWRCACKARGHENHQMTKIHVAVDCRNRLQPHYRRGTSVMLCCRQRRRAASASYWESPLGHASGLIREAVERVTDEYISWMGLPIYGADFGWGREFHMGPGALGFDGKSFILPDPDVDGSFVVPLRLQVDFMDAFKKFLYQDI